MIHRSPRLQHYSQPDVCLQTLTVPYLIDNPEVGYVQTRWIFANPDESYLTKVTLLAACIQWCPRKAPTQHISSIPHKS